MIWQYSPFLIPCVACGLILAIFAVTGWRNRSCICARSYSFLMMAASIWAFCTALELSSADMQTQMLAILIEYPAMALIPVAWLLFALEYTGREDWITKKTIALLCIVPACTVLLIATNSLHHLFYPTVVETVVGDLRYHVVTYGPAFWLHAVYSYTLICLTILLIFQRFIFSYPVYRRQVIVILIATIIPLGMNLALVFRIGSLGLVDPTPFAMVISGFIILGGMIRFQLLDLSPIANEQILENMSDGIIVADTQDRIVSLNTPASRFLERIPKKVIGLSIMEVLPGAFPGLTGPDGRMSETEQIHELKRETGGKTDYFEIRYLPLRSRNGGIKGRVIMVRNITGEKLNEIALAAARKKLSLLSSITRHDILNQVTALLLNIEYAQEEEKDPAIREWLNRQEVAVQQIQHQVEFARDYESLGSSSPVWINVNNTYQVLQPVMKSRGITLDIVPEEIEIFGDPLLERVAFNLVNNSIQHGGQVTTIRVRYEKRPEGLLIIYEDDGTGVPGPDKERIFQRGTGRDSGLGLFLVSEILGITGMTIRECGEPGKGARFEVHVPPEHFRIKSMRNS
jgi:PAS domain S-box-containing protein